MAGAVNRAPFFRSGERPRPLVIVAASEFGHIDFDR